MTPIVPRPPLLLLDEGHCLRDQALEVCQLAGFRPDLGQTRAASLTTAVQQEFDVRPSSTLRSTDAVLDLESTWLERINAYNAAYSSKSALVRKAVK